MINAFHSIFENGIFQLSMGVLAIGSIFSDALFGQYGFQVTLVLFLILLLWSLVDEYQEYTFYTNETIPIPVIVSVDDTIPLETIYASILLEIGKNPKYKKLDKALKKYFHVDPEMLMFKYSGSIYEYNRLLSFLNIIRYQLNEIEKRLNNKVQFHVAYLRRPAVAVAMGGMFRTDGIVVYQNNDHKDRFDKVATIDSRQYKEHVTEFKKFTLSRELPEPEDNNIVVFVQISSHKVSHNNSQFEHFKNRIFMQSKGNGTITMDEDWVRYAQEIYSLISQLDPVTKKITLVHSMPEAVGLILGMALENYWDITITQYTPKGYKNVVTLDQITYYF